MMQAIALEFEEPIFSSSSLRIVEVFALPGNKYWVAMADNKVVGTIGLMQLSDNNAVLKSMFVDKAFRGQSVSRLLMQMLIDWTTEHGCKEVYLGTMSQFMAAQRFYEKNGFERCNRTDLPSDFIANPLDSVFYRGRLSE